MKYGLELSCESIETRVYFAVFCCAVPEPLQLTPHTLTLQSHANHNRIGIHKYYFFSFLGLFVHITHAKHFSILSISFVQANEKKKQKL